MPPLRIGVNALYLIPGGVGGTEIYLRNLLAALAEVDPDNEYVVFTNKETGPDLTPDAPNFQQRPAPVRGENRTARILFEQLRLPGLARRERLDVLFNPGFTAPARCPCRRVSVFHDLQHKRLPEHFRAFDLPFWRYFLWLSARASDTLIAVSNATADDLRRYYPKTARRVRVVHHGVDEQFHAIAGERAPERFLLCVSTLHPHKNIERLVRVFSRFREDFPSYQLVLAGMRGFEARAIEETVDWLGLNDSVRITGWLPRDELYDLYRRAWAFVYPSTFEGFGMPVLEALAAGVPTACSAIPPLREVAGDAALFFPPDDDDGMLDALERITADNNLRRDLSSGGRARAEQFTWRNTAMETLSILREIAGRL